IGGQVKGVVSVKKYQLYEAGIDAPELSRWVSFGLTSRYRNYPQEDFWGLGPNTPKTVRGTYLMEDLDTTATVSTSVGKFRVGANGGFLKINTGPGHDTRFPTVPEAFDEQPRFSHIAALAASHRNARLCVPVPSAGRIACGMEASCTNASPEEKIPFFMLPFVAG